MDPTGVTLLPIPTFAYHDYRYEVIFRAYKWDPQVYDTNTISPYVALLDYKTAEQLERWTEQLFKETIRMEEALLQNLSLAEELGLPQKALKALTRIRNYDAKRHVRLMRFDFHPTDIGWAVSEVNSDVPGGLAEASILPGIAQKFFPETQTGPDTNSILLEAFRVKVKPGGRIAFIHATSYADDRQVMQCLSDRFHEGGFDTLFAAPDHIEWRDGRAFSVIDEQEGLLDGIARFFPLEWLVHLPPKTKWEGYFDGKTPSCNHPIAMLSQSKRLPLIWDRLGVEVPIWKFLLPETIDPKTAVSDGDWLYKPALGRVGEGIAFKGITPEKEWRRIQKAAHRQPKDWIAQRGFHSYPLTAPDGQSRHLCVGVFAVDGRAAGFYGRAGRHPLIEARAEDVPILISKESGHG